MTDLVAQLVGALEAADFALAIKGIREDGSTRGQIRAALSAAKDGGWQDAETAPKDTMVLAAVEFDHPGDWRIKTGYLDSEVGAWRVFGASWTPTKWQPLPNPPKGEV